MASSEQRRYIRSKLRSKVKVTHPNIGAMELQTGDISDGGAYILYASVELQPNIGEIVEVQVQGLPGPAAPILKMRVMRKDKEGVGLEFAE